MHARDCEPEGFEWAIVDDAANAVFAWTRHAPDSPTLLVVANMTPVLRTGYRAPVPVSGFWREVLNTDAHDYGGTGAGNFGGVLAEDGSLTLTLPPLSTLILEHAP
jgi:1,4-alpha-glucan branching enzyme